MDPDTPTPPLLGCRGGPLDGLAVPAGKVNAQGLAKLWYRKAYYKPDPEDDLHGYWKPTDVLAESERTAVYSLASVNGADQLLHVKTEA